MPPFSSDGGRLNNVMRTGASISRLCLAHLSGSHLLFFRHFDHQAVVLHFQRPDAVDVNGEPIVQMLQILFLLQARDPGRGQRCRGRRSSSFTAWGSSRHSGSKGSFLTLLHHSVRKQTYVLYSFNEGVKRRFVVSLRTAVSRKCCLNQKCDSKMADTANITAPKARNASCHARDDGKKANGALPPPTGKECGPEYLPSIIY